MNTLQHYIGNDNRYIRNGYQLLMAGPPYSTVSNPVRRRTCGGQNPLTRQQERTRIVCSPGTEVGQLFPAQAGAAFRR